MIVSLLTPTKVDPELKQWCNDVEDALNNNQIPVYAASQLPPANVDGLLIFVPDASGAPAIAVSLGGQWMRLPTSGVIT